MGGSPEALIQRESTSSMANFACSGVNELKPMKWGLVPNWAPDPSIGDRMINARAETITEKPSFKRLVQQRRCLIPADGFYEWRREGNGKVPVWIHLKNKEPFAFAGLWDVWPIQKNRLSIRSRFTTVANALLRPIHNRMPVIFDRLSGKQWLDPMFGPNEATPRCRVSSFSLCANGSP